MYVCEGVDGIWGWQGDKKKERPDTNKKEVHKPAFVVAKLASFVDDLCK